MFAFKKILNSEHFANNSINKNKYYNTYFLGKCSDLKESSTLFYTLSLSLPLELIKGKHKTGSLINT